MTAAAKQAAQASEALTQALVRAAARGIRPRCGDSETAYLWLSDHDGERKHAALMCRGCVVWAECDEVGQHQRFGTWGGVDRTRSPGRKRDAA
jgi:transcription factor WhiB